MCFYNDGDCSTIWRDVSRKARKSHRCEECSEPINPGENYVYVASLYDGSWSDYKFCRRCQWDQRRIFLLEKADGCHWSESLPGIGELHEALVDRGLERWPKALVPAEFPAMWIDGKGTWTELAV